LLGETALDTPTDITQKRAPVPGWVNHGEVKVDLSRNTLVIAGDEAWAVEGLEDVPPLQNLPRRRRTTQCTRRLPASLGKTRSLPMITWSIPALNKLSWSATLPCTAMSWR